MARMSRAVESVSEQTTLTIERKEVIGTLDLSPDGQVNPIEWSFLTMGEYLAENLIPNGRIQLEFRYGSHRWYAGAEPIDE